MLIIRKEQFEALAAAHRDHFVEEMCRHLRDHLPGQVAGVEDAVLRHRVSQAVGRAAGYGLTSRRDCCRYLNVAALYGWEFDRAPENAWMRRYLEDPQVSSPSDRLGLLVDQCIHRMRVEEENRRLAEEFAAGGP